jgi:xanthine dehydrogenase small subunit
MARIQRLQSLQSSSLQLQGFHAPGTVAELAEALQAQPDAQLLAGGTDMGLLVTKELRELPAILYLGRIEELRQVRITPGTLEIGAGVCLSDAWAAIVVSYPQLKELALRFASPPICNSGTLCGNIANGSPIGDSMPILIALGAWLTLRCGSQTRNLPLDQFYSGYRRTALQPAEFITTVNVPQPASQLRYASYKLAKRFDQDISAVCVGIAVTVEDDTIAGARLAFGGMAGTPARAPSAEAVLLGQPWSAASWGAAAAALERDFKPLSDQRASSHYRLQAAGNLLRRFYLEQVPGDAPVRLDAVQAAP